MEQIFLQPIKIKILIFILAIFLAIFFVFSSFYFYKIFYWKAGNISFCVENCGLDKNPYFWLENYNSENSLCHRIVPPYGYERTQLEKNSFEEWLRYLPLKQGNQAIVLHNGKTAYQSPHIAIVDIDIGEKNLQQCADAVMRLRAEYLFTKKEYEQIHFNFVSGFTASYLRWRDGFRPLVIKDFVKEAKTAAFDDSWKGFREYLNMVFNYANSFSLEQELIPVEDINNVRIGDVFISGGFPGHAEIIVDMAENQEGDKVFLLAQSNRPAQDIHISKNLDNFQLGGWFSMDFGEVLDTPGWEFKKTEIRRFRQ